MNTVNYTIQHHTVCPVNSVRLPSLHEISDSNTFELLVRSPNAVIPSVSTHRMPSVQSKCWIRTTCCIKRDKNQHKVQKRFFIRTQNLTSDVFIRRFPWTPNLVPDLEIGSGTEETTSPTNFAAPPPPVLNNLGPLHHEVNICPAFHFYCQRTKAFP